MKKNHTNIKQTNHKNKTVYKEENGTEWDFIKRHKSTWTKAERSKFYLNKRPWHKRQPEYNPKY